MHFGVCSECARFDIFGEVKVLLGDFYDFVPFVLSEICCGFFSVEGDEHSVIFEFTAFFHANVHVIIGLLVNIKIIALIKLEIKERGRIGFGFQTFFEQFCVSFTLSLLKVPIAYVAEVISYIIKDFGWRLEILKCLVHGIFKACSVHTYHSG